MKGLTDSLYSYSVDANALEGAVRVYIRTYTNYTCIRARTQQFLQAARARFSEHPPTHPFHGAGVIVVQRVTCEATESLLKLELLLVTVQSPLPLVQQALLVHSLRAQKLAHFVRENTLVQLRHFLLAYEHTSLSFGSLANQVELIPEKNLLSLLDVITRRVGLP